MVPTAVSIGFATGSAVGAEGPSVTTRCLETILDIINYKSLT